MKATIKRGNANSIIGVGVLVAFSVLSVPPAVHAQAVTVTATVQSSSGGLPYALGTYQVNLVDAAGNPLSVPGYQSSFSGALSSAGSLSLNLVPNAQIQSGSKWKFQICSALPIALASPSPSPSPSCFSAAVTIAGAGSISSTLNAAAAPFYGCTQWSGTAWAACGGSGTFSALTGDATSTSTGGATEVVGLLNNLLPSLTTGYLNWNGSAWVLDTPAGTGDVTGPASSTAGDVATFSDTTGKAIQDAGFKPAAAIPNLTVLTTSTTLACNTPYASNSTGSLTETMPAVATGCAGNLVNENSGTTTLSSTTTIYCVSGGSVTSTTTCAISGYQKASWSTDGTNWFAFVTSASTAGIANIQITVGTTAVSANSCVLQTAQTMTGVATTSTFKFTPSTDVSAVTGWSPGTGGQLYFTSWPTANTLNYYVCNPTSASITPGASTTWNVSAQ